ncbi:MAG: hypothetical protein ACKPKO_10145, partial [Candidatus Fonsibacter sp.]
MSEEPHHVAVGPIIWARGHAAPQSPGRGERYGTESEHVSSGGVLKPKPTDEVPELYNEKRLYEDLSG